MKVYFRVDSSTEMGSGHLMRCLTLADELHKKGVGIFFICRTLPGNLCSLIEKRGYKFYRLPHKEIPVPHGKLSLQHAQWLGVSWETDAAETKTLLEKEGAVDWLIVDHYALDARWEKEMRPVVKRIMVIDDIADRQHDCDVLLDQNLYDDMEKRYAGLVPHHCKKLLGPEFAMLRPEFREVRKTLRERDGSVRRMLVFIGGGDPSDETTKALMAIQYLNRPEITVDVVVGTSNLHKDQVRELCSGLHNTNFYCQVENMASLMAVADLAIGGGGTATWERCCLGLPAIAIVIAENQADLTCAAAKDGVAVNMGPANEVTAEYLGQRLMQLLQEKEILHSLSLNGMKLVDGMGIERVLKNMGVSFFQITVVSDAQNWINDYIPALIKTLEETGNKVQWVPDAAKIPEGDFVFYLGCSQIIPPSILSRNKHNLVIHESALPGGKGWSPLTWQILEGRNEIPITLFEAVEAVDSGRIYLRGVLKFEGTELVDQLRKAQAEASIKMCLGFVQNYPDIVVNGVEQKGEATFYRRRTPEDSRLDPDKTIREQFNLLRVIDNERYPAFFEIEGITYFLKIISKQKNEKAIFVLEK